MDKLTQYRTYIEQILREYSTYKPAYGEVEMEVVIDHQHDHYQLLTIGWHKHQRIHGTILHIDIRDGKIWIQQDGTEEGVANRFVEQGVPKTDIVLGFQPPYKRPYTDFAIG
ncbi:MAG: XisI protein [Chloroflexia bacterium]|jgi:ketopantoate reductase|nr:XisI protein [Chloroflexia bacterium]